jgi:diguanylate cyclase (GGDEF)-like protein
MNPNPDQSSSSPQHDQVRPHSSTLAWIVLAVVAAVALGLVVVSMKLHAHADERRDVMEQLTALQVDGSGQNTLVWVAMTQLMADEKLPFVRTRGQEQYRRGRIYNQVRELRELEESGQRINGWLGYEPAPDLLVALEGGSDRFLGGVQSAFGLMNLSRERVRQRLSSWDMGYGAFEQALSAVRDRAEQIAQQSSIMANRVTGAAAILTLLAALLFVTSLVRTRAMRARELQAERLRTVAASESRLRGLVQNSSDLIIVVEPNGTLRYSTPSVKEIQPQTDVPDADSTRIESLLGLTVQELMIEPRTEVALRDLAGSNLVYEILATDLTANEDVGGIVLNGRDITQAKALEDQLRYQALHDPLTGLPNRRYFSERFDALSLQERENYCVFFIDLDGFKLVNDSYGHTVGDQLLKHTATRISTCLQESDLLARQGGDEFIVLCSELAAATKIQEVLMAPFEIGKGIGPSVSDARESLEIFISASIGVVTDMGDIDAEQVAQRADIAMYQAKEAGKAQTIVFTEDMLASAPERLSLESDFRRSLERNEFTVVYQPKVGLKSGVTESLEALVRWVHPQRGFVGPDLFIPFAEESGLVNELGRQVLEKACLDAVRWQAFNVVVAVNLSPIQFRNPNLVGEVRDALQLSGLDPKFLELEITESAVLGDVSNTIRVMRELKQLGVRLAIDDFGTGYSNLAHLKHFDVDVLKIDQAFVRGENSVEELSDGAIVEAVIGMARAFDMHVVAEGVESSNHAAQLKELGADLGQGFFFSKPVSGQGIDDFLSAEVTDGKREALTELSDS